MSEPHKPAGAIFDAAIELPPERRPAYLQEVCMGDEALRQRVEALLRAHDTAGTFMDRPAVAATRETTVAKLVEQSGDRLGLYTLREKIGEGGCGVVYVAEQEKPVRRRVALKVIKLGMDTKAVIARFAAERQALALMDHPNIAKVLDAGASEAGRPYFVMELVSGIKITDYCDQHNLTTTERLVLFTLVCHAIQHAHQKGIIHRDIKSSNILVAMQDGVPVPKVIDFGIAKATEGRLTDLTNYTELHQFIGTPAYMSPEQASLTAADVDARSDIYSLGVLLYELLTGRTPLDQKELLEGGMDAMRQTIRDREPPRPSTRLSTLSAADLTTVARARQSEPPKLIHSVRGDLDWIVMKAMEKDRTRRYETANGLARDIQRHLNNEPVAAFPPSNLYRFQKLVRRNKLAFAAVSAVAASLIIGLGLSTWLLVKETEARNNEAKLRLQAGVSENKAKSEAERAQAASIEAKLTLEASDFSQATRLSSEGHFADALPYLARILSVNPTNAAALTRLATLLTYHSWMVPTLILNHSNWVYSAQFSRDGKRIVTASADHTARVWDALTGLAVTDPLKHEGGVESAEFSPDGKWVVTGSYDGNAWVWDAQSGQPVTGPLKHRGAVYSAHFSPDGTRIVTASEDGTARVWDSVTGQPLTPALKHRAKLQSAQFSPDGKWVVTASDDNTARVWDAQTGHPVTGPLGHDSRLRPAEFSPDGERVVTASRDMTARVWDAQTGLPVTGPLRHDDRLWSAHFSPDGKWIVTSSYDRTARLWDALTGLPLAVPLKHDSIVRSAQFSPNGEQVITASEDGTARVWDAKSGAPLTEPLKHGGGLWLAQFSPDGKRIVTSSRDNSARVWDPLSRQPLNQSFKHGHWLRSAQFSPDGRKIVTASNDKTARVWDAENGLPVTESLHHGGVVEWAQFSPDGKWVVTASDDHTARVWDAQSGRPLATLRHDGSVAYAEFSPDGKWVATASDDHTARVWDAQNGQQLATLRHDGTVRYAEFSPDGRRVVTASDDHTARIWETQNGRQLALLQHEERVLQAQFSPDGTRIVTCGHDHTARIWDATSGAPLTGPLTHFDSVLSAQFSPDSKRVVTASWDHTARVWDAQSGRPLTPPLKHAEVVNCARFSPDGKRIATASDDNTARVWDAETGLPLTEPLAHGGWVWTAQFSPDGNRVVTASDDRTARVWDVAPAQAKCPDWLPLLAEAISGETIDKRGLMEETGLNRVETLNQIRQKLQAESDGDDWVVWGRWFLAEPSTRTISPFSKCTVREYIENRIKEQTSESLDEAERLAAGDTELLEKISAGRRRRIEKANPLGVLQRSADLSAIPRRDMNASSNLIDLSAHYNAGLTETWHSGRLNNSLINLPSGVQTLAGVAFDIRGLIQLRGESIAENVFPERVVGIRVDRACRELHFLHATQSADSEGRQIGHYVVHYDNGSEVSLPVIYGQNVRDWYVKSNQPGPPDDLPPAWLGSNAQSEAVGFSIRVSKWTWTNPFPRLGIRSIDFVSEKTRCAPFLVAITAD